MASVPAAQPKKAVLRDQVTPYKVTLLVLVDEYCKVIARREGGELEPEEYMSEEEDRELMITLLHLVQGADIDLVEFVKKLTSLVKSTLVDSIMDKLKQVSEDGVHALMDLFHTIPDSLTTDPPRLHTTSVLGLFVRRMVLAFSKLDFSQVTLLHKKYLSFYKHWSQADDNRCVSPEMSALDIGGTSSSFLDMINQDSREAGDSKLADRGGKMLDTGKYSQRQAELFIAQQTSLLQHNQDKALSPKQLQQKLNELLQSNPDLAEAHYLSYLNYLRILEYCGAIKSLYHYFDRLPTSNPAHQGSGVKGKQEEEILPRNFRYAALNLAALQYRFGHRSEALAAVEEAICLAQKTSDHVCLQHALGWLQRLGAQGTGKTAYMLDRLVNKAGELNLAYLTSLGVQGFAKHNALASLQPATVLEFLVKSDIVNCQHSLSDLMCISYAQKAALWHLYGRREMCSLSSQCMLLLNTMDQSVYHSGEAECTALCHVANIHMEQGEYELAASVLQAASSRYPPNTQHARMWMLCQQYQSFTRYVYHNKLDQAEKAIISMSAVSNLEASYCRCILLKERGEVQSALTLCQSLLDTSRSQQHQHQELSQVQARLLLLQGELWCCAGNPSTATAPLLQCLTMCESRHYSYMAAMATVLLAFVQYHLGLPGQAVGLLEQVLTTVLCHGSLYDRTRARYLWTRCQVAVAGKMDKADKQQALLSAVQSMNEVIEGFRKIEFYSRVKDSVYFQARLYHELGYVSERNQCAHEFRELDQQYPTWHVSTVSCL